MEVVESGMCSGEKLGGEGGRGGGSCWVLRLIGARFFGDLVLVLAVWALNALW